MKRGEKEAVGFLQDTGRRIDLGGQRPERSLEAGAQKRRRDPLPHDVTHEETQRSAVVSPSHLVEVPAEDPRGPVVDPDLPARNPRRLGEKRSVEHLDLIELLLEPLQFELRHAIQADLARRVDGDELALDRAVAIPALMRDQIDSVHRASSRSMPSISIKVFLMSSPPV